MEERRLSTDRSPTRLARGTESGSDERGNRATLCACSASLPSVGSGANLSLSLSPSLCHRRYRLRCVALLLAPPSLSLSLSLLPRLESHAYAATNVRGVNPRELPGLRSVAASLMIAPSRALPFCRRVLALSLPLSLSLSFARSFLLRRRLKTRPRAPRDPKPRENARSFARLPLAARGDHESMSYGG